MVPLLREAKACLSAWHATPCPHLALLPQLLHKRRLLLRTHAAPGTASCNASLMGYGVHCWLGVAGEEQHLRAHAFELLHHALRIRPQSVCTSRNGPQVRLRSGAAAHTAVVAAWITGKCRRN